LGCAPDFFSLGKIVGTGRLDIYYSNNINMAKGNDRKKEKKKPKKDKVVKI